MAKHWKSGPYEGHYQSKGKKYQLACEMNFTAGGTVKGNGIDDERGYFDIAEGTYVNAPPYSVSFTANFRSSDQVPIKFTGWREATGGLFGQFESGTMKGNFALSVSKASESMRKLEEEASKRKLTELMQMGFPQELCEQALREMNSVDAAAEWCLSRLGHSSHPATPAHDSDAPSSGDGEPSEEAIRQVCDMGFERDRAILALKASGGSVERAVEFLFG